MISFIDWNSIDQHLLTSTITWSVKEENCKYLLTASRKLFLLGTYGMGFVATHDWWICRNSSTVLVIYHSLYSRYIHKMIALYNWLRCQTKNRINIYEKKMTSTTWKMNFVSKTDLFPLDLRVAWAENEIEEKTKENKIAYNVMIGRLWWKCW